MSTRTKTVLAFLPSADFVASEPGGRDTASRQGGAFAENGDRPGTDSVCCSGAGAAWYNQAHARNDTDRRVT